MKADKYKIRESLYRSEDARLDAHDLKTKYGKSMRFFNDDKTDTQGFAYIKDRTLFISFRGTQQKKDWLTDINAVHMIYPYGNSNTKIMVHR